MFRSPSNIIFREGAFIGPSRKEDDVHAGARKDVPPPPCWSGWQLRSSGQRWRRAKSRSVKVGAGNGPHPSRLILKRELHTPPRRGGLPLLEEAREPGKATDCRRH